MTLADKEKLAAVFQAVFELPAGSDVSGLQAGHTEAWDSLATVSLVAAIESEFTVTFDADDMLRLNSYAAALRFLEEQGV